jgi:hypothetical protein
LTVTGKDGDLSDGNKKNKKIAWLLKPYFCLKNYKIDLYDANNATLSKSQQVSTIVTRDIPIQITLPIHQLGTNCAIILLWELTLLCIYSNRVLLTVNKHVIIFSVSKILLFCLYDYELSILI